MRERRTATIVVGADGRVREIDAAALPLTGGRAVLGTHWRDLLPPCVGAPLDIDPGARRGGASYCRLFATPGGPTAWLLHVDAPGPDTICRFEPLSWSVSLADHWSAFVFVTGTDGEVAYCNHALRRCVRRAANLSRPGVRNTITSALGIESGVARRLRTLADAGTSCTHECEGPLGSMEVETTPLWHFGRACGTIWVARPTPGPPVGDRQAMAALAWRMAATYQHQLRNPLQTIRAAIALLRNEGDAPNLRDLLDIIERNALRISETLDTRWSPVACARTGPQVFSRMVDRAIQAARRRWAMYGVSFQHDIPAGEPRVHCPVTGLDRAFAHVFQNAAQARPDAHIRVSYQWDRQRVLCRIDDDGPGFPPEALTDLLLPHDPAGRLGLAVVAATLEAAGGGLGLESAPEGGARVTLWLPRAARGAPAIRTPVAVGADTLRSPGRWTSFGVLPGTARTAAGDRRRGLTTAMGFWSQQGCGRWSSHDQ